MKRRLNPYKMKLQRGMTILEVVIALAITAVVVGMVFAYFSPTQNSAQANSEAQRFAHAVQKIRETYTNRPGFTGITSTIVAGSNAFPGLTTGSTITNPWGGTVTFAAANCNGTDDCVTITYPAVPEGVCRAVIPRLDSFAARIDATPSASSTATTIKALNTAFDPALVSTGCNGTTQLVAYFTKG